MSTARRILSLVATVALWALIGAGVGTVLAVVAPLPLGAKPYTVLTGSMEPGIHPGDIVVSKGIDPREAELGDVITFQDPSGDGDLITHRLERVHVVDGEAQMVTRGDANDTAERWKVPVDGQIGVVLYRLPKLGYVLQFARNGVGPVVLISIPIVLIAIFQLISIWRPRRMPEQLAPSASPTGESG